MSAFELLHGQAAKSLIEAAADRHVQILAMAKDQNRWVTLQSRMVMVADGRVWIEASCANQGGPLASFAEQACCLSFRDRAFRYFFTGSVHGPESIPGDDGAQGLWITQPQELERIERRAFQRVDVPSGCNVRARLWIGQAQQPAWLGKVVNLSLGGLQVRTAVTARDYFEPGDVVNLAITFDQDDDPITLAAYFRSGANDGDMALMGFEFIALDALPERTAAFDLIRKKVSEFKSL